jgi:hypothetical protein
MNILMIIDFYPPQIGGIEYHVENLSRFEIPFLMVLIYLQWCEIYLENSLVEKFDERLY